MPKPNAIHNLHALEGLRKLPSNSIDMVLTSPPYWNLRNYGKHTDVIWGGKPKCKHKFGDKITLDRKRGEQKKANVGNSKKGRGAFTSTSQFCQKCKAWKGQLGLEPTIDLFINHLTEIFDEVHRVVKKTGTCWVNLGDTYYKPSVKRNTSILPSLKKNKLTSKSLSLIPFRFALAMINRGWILRNVIIWHKPNAIPASVKDRFTVDFEYLLFFSQSKKYYFEQQFEPIKSSLKRGKCPNRHLPGSLCKQHSDIVNMHRHINPSSRNKRCVWSISTKPCKEAHFATFPQDLCNIPINAGCPKEVCRNCGMPKGPGCKCNAGFTPGIIIDPFMGSGTTAIAAQNMGRDYIGFELNSDYIKIAKKRIREASQ